MAVWSSISRGILGAGGTTKFCFRHVVGRNVMFARLMSHGRQFEVKPSRWQWDKFKDLLHFYILMGAIPLGLVCLYANIFIGPAQLQPIPEGYQPKEWEYYRHPITRFFVKYLMPSEQMVYERHLHQLYENYDLMEINRIENEVRMLQSKRSDYQHWYYVPVDRKHVEVIQEENMEMDNQRGKPYSPYD